jgi:hypothetical protein
VDSFQALLIDGDPEGRAAVPGRIGPFLAELGWSPSWEIAAEPREARAIMSGPDRFFRLIVVDLLVGGPSDGLELVEEARECFPDAFILAVGPGSAPGDPWPKLFADARYRGAHRVLRRHEFEAGAAGGGPRAIAAAVHDHLLEAGVFEPIAAVYDEDDPHVLALVHEVGESALVGLYLRVLESRGWTARRMRIRFLAPGSAGAAAIVGRNGPSGVAVYAVESEVHGAGLPTEGLRVHHVLTVDRDRSALSDEAKRGVAAATLLRGSPLVRQEPGYPVGPVSGWYALVSRVHGQPRTLSRWLAAGPEAQRIEDLFEALFTDGLGGLYADTLDPGGSASALFWMPPHIQRRVASALDELGSVLSHPLGCALEDTARYIERLRAFVLQGRLGAGPELSAHSPRPSQPTFRVHGHGNLLVNNVIVSYDSRHPQPTVIDTRRFGPGHWAADPARLAVDLLMRCVDHGTQSAFFTGVPVWRTLARRMGLLEPLEDAVSEEAGTVAALRAISWLTHNLRGYCPAVAGELDFATHRWEWHAALAGELLRGAADPTLPVPKRALGVVAAFDQLIAAESALLAD